MSLGRDILAHEPKPGEAAEETEVLLGRPELQADLRRAREYLCGKTVLVSGSGGSIGSAVCRELLECGVGKLIGVDRSEQAVYDIDEELACSSGGTEVVTILGDVASRKKMTDLFSQHRPDVIYHAAAYKHVKYVEQNPEEGVLNNIFATKCLAEVALACGVSKFVLISSDKAVEPTSVYGATKRICELIMADLAGQRGTEFMTVRFGNVLRSSGSVIPKLERQIRDGGPVTISDPEARRYFMSMHEAVGFVLSSTVSGTSGTICIQTVGEQVKMIDIAQRLIDHASGNGVQMDIVFTGLMTGEKVSEILIADFEGQNSHEQDGILCCDANNRLKSVNDDLLRELRQAAENCERERLISLLATTVPEYTPSTSS